MEPAPAPTWRHNAHSREPVARATRRRSAGRNLRNEFLVFAEHPPRTTLALGLLQEADADFVAFHVDQLAFPVGIADRRQHQEELVELEVLHAAFDGELRAALR